MGPVGLGGAEPPGRGLDGRDIEDQNPNAMAMVDEFLAVVAEKAEWVGDGELGGQARDLRERIAASRAGEVAAG